MNSFEKKCIESLKSCEDDKLKFLEVMNGQGSPLTVVCNLQSNQYMELSQSTDLQICKFHCLIRRFIKFLSINSFWLVLQQISSHPSYFFLLLTAAFLTGVLFASVFCLRRNKAKKKKLRNQSALVQSPIYQSPPVTVTAPPQPLILQSVEAVRPYVRLIYFLNLDKTFSSRLTDEWENHTTPPFNKAT